MIDWNVICPLKTRWATYKRKEKKKKKEKEVMHALTQGV